jgi:hypothetical protein
VRTGCHVSRLAALAAWARQGPPEPPLLAGPRRAAAIAAAVVALTGRPVTCWRGRRNPAVLC